MLPSVYINLEDDVAKVIARIKKEKASELVLVCPKRCQLFSDSINLRLLKKQSELLQKRIFILTMDERGQLYAQEAGFALKFFPKGRRQEGVSDIKIQKKIQSLEIQPAKDSGGLAKTVKGVANFVSGLVSKKNEGDGAGPELGSAKDNIIKRQPKVNYQAFEPETESKAKKPKKSQKTYALFLGASLILSLIVVLGLIFAVLPRATVVVFPKTEPITRDFDVNFDFENKQPDPAKLLLPAVKFEETVDIKSKFKSSGKKDVGNKAFGAVRIYNFTGQPLNLKGETTLLTAGVKAYRLAEDALQIRPTRYKNAQTKEIDETSLSPAFEIIAAAGGEDSNLPAGVRMEIANQVFGSRPQLLYAKTDSLIKGGTFRFLSVVTLADITAAQTDLGGQALKRVEDKLGQNRLKFLENSYRLEVLEFLTDKAEGAESPTFEASFKAKITGLAFVPETLKSLVIERTGQTLAGARYLKTASDFNLNYKIRNIDLNIPAGVLAVHFEGKVLSKLNLDGLPRRLIGKNRREVSELLQAMPEIDKADITLSPSWQTNFPWFAGKITVQSKE